MEKVRFRMAMMAMLPCLPFLALSGVIMGVECPFEVFGQWCHAMVQGEL